jgi:hypothetical protein
LFTGKSLVPVEPAERILAGLADRKEAGLYGSSHSLQYETGSGRTALWGEYSSTQGSGLRFFGIGRERMVPWATLPLGQIRKIVDPNPFGERLPLGTGSRAEYRVQSTAPHLERGPEFLSVLNAAFAATAGIRNTILYNFCALRANHKQRL